MSARDAMTTQSKVAAVLTCCNEGPYIGAAVGSILKQTRADLVESIVITDAGSSPDTIAVLKDIERWDARIDILYGAAGSGPSAQRNRAIAHTRAPLIALLDGDDLWVPGKLETQLAALAAAPDIGLVYSGYFMFAAGDLSDAREASIRDITTEADLTRAYFLSDPPVIPSTALIRRSAFEACGRFDPAVSVFEDTDFCLRMSRVCRFGFVGAPLVYKRSRPTSVTRARKDLMAHHAFVALKAAAEEPRLLPLVPRRLAERARKLGNEQFVLGNFSDARRLLRFATRLDPRNLRAWAGLAVACGFARPAHRLISSQLRSRRAALGVAKP